MVISRVGDGARWSAGDLEEVELRGATDGGAAARHAELRVDVFRMRSERVQRHDELVRHLRTVELALQEPEDLQLALAQLLDEWLLAGRVAGSRAGSGGEQLMQVRGCAAALRGDLEQRRHRRTLVEEEPDVALGLGEGDRPIERDESRLDVAGRVSSEGVRDEGVE